MKASDLHPLTLVPLICLTDHLPAPVAEFKFHPTRKWRFDWCWPDQKVALEVNGGVWTRGRHVRGQGYLNDLEKLNEAQLIGWMVLQITPQTAHLAADLLKRALRPASQSAPLVPGGKTAGDGTMSANSSAPSGCCKRRMRERGSKARSTHRGKVA